MSISSLGLQTVNFTASQACVEYRSVAAIAPRLIEFSFVVQGTGTIQSIGLGRPATVGVSPVNSLFQRDVPATSTDPASTTNGAIAWSAPPTSPLIFHRRWSCAAISGVGVIWVFPRGLIIPVSSSLVCFNITATVAAIVNAVVDE